MHLAHTTFELRGVGLWEREARQQRHGSGEAETERVAGGVVAIERGIPRCGGAAMMRQAVEAVLGHVEQQISLSAELATTMRYS
jgi:hypothetical protein